VKKIIYVAGIEPFLQRHSVQDFSLVYNHLVTAIKDLCGDKNKFKVALKDISYIIPFIVWRNILIHN
jgi:hypothetical protein